MRSTGTEQVGAKLVATAASSRRPLRGPEDVATWQALLSAVACACGIAQPVVPPAPCAWRGFVELTRRHGVGALVHRSGWAAGAGAPDWVSAELASDAQAATLGALHLLAVQRDAVRALEQAGIDVIVLKGLALAQEAHGSLDARHPGDLDLLVDPERVVDAIAALGRHGFRWLGIDLPASMRPPDGGLAALRRARDLRLVREAMLDRSGLALDLHWRLTVNPMLMPVAPRWLENPRSVEVAGVLTPVLPIPAAWWYVLVHGAQHRWSRLKWVGDVPAMVLTHPELVSTDALRAASAYGLDRCVALGLRVAERLLGPFLPAGARDWAGAISGVDGLVRRSVAAAGASTANDHVTLRTLPARTATGMSLRADRGYRVAELRGMLLEAGRLQLEPAPRLRVLATAPWHWALRAGHRHLRGAGHPL